jgi:hypothetical protein
MLPAMAMLGLHSLLVVSFYGTRSEAWISVRRRDFGAHSDVLPGLGALGLPYQ